MEVKGLFSIFGVKSPLFNTPKSTSNLVRPSFENFIDYVRLDYNEFNNTDIITELLENRLSELHGVKNVVTVVNGLWGLVLSIYALKLEGKTEIIMPSMTYRRMADIAAWLEMTPCFCDVNLNSLSITSDFVEKAINSNTALILATHPIVNVLEINELQGVAKKHNIPLLFDSVEASYAQFEGKMVGGFGNAECFSLHASKFLNGFEGGYITTNDDQLAQKLRVLRNNGNELVKNSEYATGLDMKLNKFHSAMTLASLDGIDIQVDNNKKKFYYYEELLSTISQVSLIKYSKSECRSFKNILIKLNEDWPIDRDLTIRLLHAENIIARPYYYPALHSKKYSFKTISTNLSNSDYLQYHYLLLQCGEFVTTKDIEKIVATLRLILDNSHFLNELKMAGQL
jgi:dTDP-4-amino-4,6-dideoxygalactose transaminase